MVEMTTKKWLDPSGAAPQLWRRHRGVRGCPGERSDAASHTGLHLSLCDGGVEKGCAERCLLCSCYEATQRH